MQQTQKDQMCTRSCSELQQTRMLWFESILQERCDECIPGLQEGTAL